MNERTLATTDLGAIEAAYIKASVDALLAEQYGDVDAASRYTAAALALDAAYPRGRAATATHAEQTGVSPMADQNERPEVTVGRIDLGQTEPRQPTQDEQRMMDGALRNATPIGLPAVPWDQETGSSLCPYCGESVEVDVDAGEMVEMFCTKDYSKKYLCYWPLSKAAPRAMVQNERMRAALEWFLQWSDLFPLSVFPEPDESYYAKAHEVLVANGMTLDRLSAAAMRHVITQVGKIARKGLG